jgi:F0F1-type ATP synthase alpha subunit
MTTLLRKNGLDWYILCICSCASSTALLSYLLPIASIAIAERMRDRGYDMMISFDDLSKHSKAYRQISLINHSIPSRSCFPADIFNIHSSLLERACKMRLSYWGGSITAFPIIETINSDISEYIATNIISITDGQLYMSRRLFLTTSRPAIDSALSVSRIGSNAQCKMMKESSAGIKNTLTTLRIDQGLSSLVSPSLVSLNHSFNQEYLMVSTIDFTISLLNLYRIGINIIEDRDIHTLSYLLSTPYFPLSYLSFLSRTHYTPSVYILIKYYLSDISRLMYPMYV